MSSVDRHAQDGISGAGVHAQLHLDVIGDRPALRSTGFVCQMFLSFCWFLLSIAIDAPEDFEWLFT
jgi:hypothetical protein